MLQSIILKPIPHTANRFDGNRFFTNFLANGANVNVDRSLQYECVFPQGRIDQFIYTALMKNILLRSILWKNGIKPKLFSALFEI